MSKRKKERIETRDSGFESNMASLFEGLSFPLEEADSKESDAVLQSEPMYEPSALLAPLKFKGALRFTLSKKGRGGKMVTQLQMRSDCTAEEYEKFAKATAKALGCRAWCEGALLCLQGEQRERMINWVEAQRSILK